MANNYNDDDFDPDYVPQRTGRADGRESFFSQADIAAMKAWGIKNQAEAQAQAQAQSNTNKGGRRISRKNSLRRSRSHMKGGNNWVEPKYYHSAHKWAGKLKQSGHFSWTRNAYPIITYYD